MADNNTILIVDDILPTPPQNTMIMEGISPQGGGAFSINVANNISSDSILITLQLPRIVNVPYIGPTSIQSIGVAIATCTVTCLLLWGRRTVKRLQQYAKKQEERVINEEKKKEAAEPVKAKQWEVVQNGKLDEFINNEINPARERLRKTEDPDTVEKRQAKRNRIKLEQKKKKSGPLGLSVDVLQNTLGGLKKGDTPLAALIEENNSKNDKEKRACMNELQLQNTLTGLRKSPLSLDKDKEDKEKARAFEVTVKNESELQNMRAALKKGDTPLASLLDVKQARSFDDDVEILEHELADDIKELEKLQEKKEEEEEKPKESQFIS